MTKNIKVLVSFAGDFKPEHVELVRENCLKQGITPIIRDPLDIITLVGKGAEIWKSKMAEADFYLGIFMKGIKDSGLGSFLERVEEAEDEYYFAVICGIPRYILIEGKSEKVEISRPRGNLISLYAQAKSLENTSRYEELKKRVALEGRFKVNYFQRSDNLDFLVKSTLLQYRASTVKFEPKPEKFEPEPEPDYQYPKSIFVSYARSDWDNYAQSVRDQLVGAGLTVWVDQHLIEGGQDWLDEINAALKRCETLALCVTPEALKSKWVKMEYRYFFSKGKPIVPVMCREADLPAELLGTQYYHYAQMKAFIDRLKKISL
jgi:TIR domain-containing protein